MLFVLTGDIQSGKTRWLEKLVESLEDAGIPTYGVLAPGIWADRRGDAERGGHVDANGFEKLGIDNVLLPSRERLAFARRADLAAACGAYDEKAQSARAKLGWHISDEALGRVNAHFDELLREAGRARDAQPRPEGEPNAGILVVDEVGRLELERSLGLTRAVAALDEGPTGLYAHALVVVRKALLPHLEGRFGAWGKRIDIAPDAKSAAFVLESAAR